MPDYNIATALCDICHLFWESRSKPAYQAITIFLEVEYPLEDSSGEFISISLTLVVFFNVSSLLIWTYLTCIIF